MEGSWDGVGDARFKRASGLIDMTPQSKEELDAIKTYVLARDRIILSVLDVLRRVPRRVLMVFKLNDLTRYVFVYQHLLVYIYTVSTGILTTH